MVSLKRLQATKSPRTGLHFLLFLCTFLVSVKPHAQPSSAVLLVNIFDSLQPKLLTAVLSSMLLPQGPKLRDRHDRNLIIVGLTKLITEAPALVTGDAEYAQMYVDTVSTIITMITSPPVGELETVASTEVSAEEQPSGSYWKLNAAPPPKRCPQIEMISDPASILVNSLVMLSRSLRSGTLPSILSSLPEASRNALASLLQQHNASIL